MEGLMRNRPLVLLKKPLADAPQRMEWHLLGRTKLMSPEEMERIVNAISSLIGAQCDWSCCGSPEFAVSVLIDNYSEVDGITDSELLGRLGTDAGDHADGLIGNAHGTFEWMKPMFEAGHSAIAGRSVSFV